MAKNVIQSNSQFMKGENQKYRYFQEEKRRKNRFMGWVLILVILLFILPTYNLIESYQNLLSRQKKLVELQRKYEELSEKKDYEASVAEKLKNDEYAAKYARAKYYYSKDGEYIYKIPGLLP